MQNQEREREKGVGRDNYFKELAYTVREAQVQNLQSRPAGCGPTEELQFEFKGHI